MDSPILSSSILLEFPEENNFLLSLDPIEEVEKEDEKKNPKDMIEGMTSKIFEETTIKNSKIGNYLHIDDYPENTLSSDFIHDAAISYIMNKKSNLSKKFNTFNLDKPIRKMIYKVKNIETVIEQTYNYDKNLKEQMIEENYYLQKVIFGWRRVAGDGNCFYRSVIFSYLEYLIFNQKINVLKNIISNLFSKFDPNYINTKRLPFNIQKFYISRERDIAIIILSIIIDFLADKKLNDDNKILNAYSFLIKAFNNSTFDTTMIFYLRYILYEFILENKDKCFSKDFEVLLGNLLPSQYENEDGTFKFDNYFNEDLLKFYTCAEKLAVYLTPYVLKIDLKVIFYDFGTDCDIETKLFQSNLKNRDNIYVLFRKAHYDICYSQDYYNRFRSYLNIYNHFNDKLYVLNKSDFENYKKKSNLFDIEGSRIFNRKLYFKRKNEKKKDKKVENNLNNNTNNNNIKNDNDNIDFTSFLTQMKNKIDNHESCFNCDKFIPQVDLNRFNLKFPCECKLILCDKECEKKYFQNFSSLIENNPFVNEFSIECPKCKKEFSISNLIDFSLLINEKLNNNSLKESLKKKLKKIFDEYCMNCKNSLANKNKHKVICKQKLISDILDERKFIHFCCDNCYNKKESICNICQLYHKRVLDK